MASALSDGKQEVCQAYEDGLQAVSLLWACLDFPACNPVSELACDLVSEQALQPTVYLETVCYQALLTACYPTEAALLTAETDFCMQD